MEGAVFALGGMGSERARKRRWRESGDREGGLGTDSD